MDTVFVDTNVFLRYLTKDDTTQAAKAKKLFQKAQSGQVKLVTGPPVFFELAWTLKVRYKLSLSEILDILETLVTTAWLSLPDKDLVEKAVALAIKSNQDFADAYIHTSAEKLGVKGVATFNRKHFTRLGTYLIDL